MLFVSRAKVMGMARHNNQLYVVYHKKPAVYVYQIQSVRPFRVRQTIHPAGIKWPRGIAVDNNTGTGYIIDWTNIFSGSLWKMSVSGSVEKIADVDVQPFGISIADNGNSIIVTCSTPVRAFLPAVGNNSKIMIFDPSGTIREIISLPDDLEIPRHTLRIERESHSEYVVIHGWGHILGQVACVKPASTGEQKIPPPTSVGHLQNGRYGSTNSGSMQSLSKPLSLLNDGDGGILVNDYGNSRIHLINYQLQFVQHILTTATNGITYPRHLSLDSRRGVLFLGLESGEIRAFQVRNPQHSVDSN